MIVGRMTYLQVMAGSIAEYRCSDLSYTPSKKALSLVFPLIDFTFLTRATTNEMEQKLFANFFAICSNDLCNEHTFIS